MHKIIVKELILKKDYDAFVYNFCDVSTTFFLLLFIHQKNETPFKLAFFEEGATLGNYVINLTTDNTKTLYDKIFEFESNDNFLEFSFVLLENYTHQALSRAKIKKIINQKNLKFSKNKEIQLHQLIKLESPINLLQSENNIEFNNSIFSIKFSLLKQ